MKIFQSRSFEKKVKKFNEKQKYELDIEIKQIIQNPLIGTEKKGDLRGVFVHKFNLQNQMYLLSYRFIMGESLELIMIGPHENYYRDLKSYLKN
ncbi:MAG: type II toxin-antitoxin system RelE/ParE family toxin [Desulfobulbaceae bacterium]|nr:type II toxin-antitoxin system RelE/ParE family toxin [Desulfobulbaceae bacterium]MDP2060512.1 type II toxin-antitoxin system RelE/ParE family toxin [Flavobacteriaceae bacterium]